MRRKCCGYAWSGMLCRGKWDFRAPCLVAASVRLRLRLSETRWPSTPLTLPHKYSSKNHLSTPTTAVLQLPGPARPGGQGGRGGPLFLTFRHTNISHKIPPRPQPLQCYNCLDRHVQAGKGDREAFYWEGNDPGVQSTVTYAQLLEEVCRVRKRGEAWRAAEAYAGVVGCNTTFG